ncbi:MAG: hypothetical protein IJK17_10565 [Lachnospiraceae bacterium]|nr:hypothetical protein [Lachnospiraceae bacterium]
MKKKILTYMMTAIFTLGCAGLSTPMTAYAAPAGDTRVHNFTTGENYIIHHDATTPEQDFENFTKRCRGLGMSDAEIQAEWERYHGSIPSGTNAASSSQVESAPTYTQEQIDAAWDEVSRTESTCAENGVITYKNSLTGKTKSEKLDLIAHTYELSSHKDATCVEEGMNTYTCSVCGDAYTEAVPIADHDYKVTHKDATCTHEGIDTFTCSVCGDTYSETIPMKEHTPGEATVTKKAKLFTEGESTVFCTECNTVLSTEVIHQICPLPLTTVLAMAGVTLLMLAGVGTGIFFIMKKSGAAVTEEL